MAEPSTTPASPFNPDAPQVARGGLGCSKPLWIGCGLGCGVLLLLLGLGALLFFTNFSSISRWLFHYYESTITPRLPADLPAAERARLHAGFAAAGRALGDHQVDLEDMQRFQHLMLRLANPETRITRRDVQELTAILETLGRSARSPAGQPAAPGPGPRGAPSAPSPSAPPTSPAPPPPAGPPPAGAADGPRA